jgi:hypothetical protein
MAFISQRRSSLPISDAMQAALGIGAHRRSGRFQSDSKG